MRPASATTTYDFDPTISSAVRAGQAPPAPASTSAAPGAAPLAPEEAALLQRYWDAANFLTVGQIYLQENPLLREPLRPAHI